MSRVCEVCGKSPKFGKNLSRLGAGAMHRRIKGSSNRKWLPNIQPVKTMVKGSKKRINVCTSCLKAGKVQKVL